ncbi:spore germination protein [Brevibacillus brevis]|uniref:Spore germination protein n=1 Tax=Brevibacillus brevis TaxID=1393 RepID=A0ABY9SWI6_BREBE|nr:spore germination protein [Brevibacillus brevis]WNC12187.1 spore germination protein [Brevibacillus brevis]
MRYTFSRYGKNLAKTTDMISTDLGENLRKLHERFADAPDLITTQFLMGETNRPALLVYLDGMVEKPVLHQHILRPLLFQTFAYTDLSNLELSLTGRKTARAWAHAEGAILSGRSVLFVDGEEHCLLLDTQGGPQRSVDEPATETVIKGARLSFVESLGQNVSLIRRYIPHHELKIKELRVGLRSRTKVALLYLGDVANLELVKELEERISRITIDGIVNVGELQELIETHWLTPFPQFMSTERPDSAASQILQGRIVIIVDQSPWVMVAPITLTSFFQSVDDYSMRWMISSFIRLLRFAGFLVSLFLPALYIAALTFHYEIIPLNLILSIGESRERVPIPPFMEAIIMEITLEMLREAGIRLPSKIGQTVGIVGGIVIGQAAVSAGIVSNIMVIVVAVTAIASFIMPNTELAAAVRILRFPMMIVAYMFGIVGIVVGMMVLIIHLLALESLGTPYGSPFAPFLASSWKDNLVRLPIWSFRNRPRSIRVQQEVRQEKHDKSGDEK